jgi:anti-anti-sigma regulatory factor
MQQLPGNNFLIEIPEQLLRSDEIPYLDASLPHETNRKSKLLLNFGKLKHINGLGISMLVKLSVLARKRNQDIIAFGISEPHVKLFNLLHLNHALWMCHDLHEAALFTGAALPSELEKIKTTTPIDTEYWAVATARLAVPEFPPEAINMNIKGRHIVGPVDGFGVLWQKRYRLPIVKPGLSPEKITGILKNEFPNFQPEYNHFYPGSRGIVPGEIIAIDSSTPGGLVSTGVMVLYADKESFTFITPQGHPESGWVTFSVERSGDALTAQILGLARANDPVYELAFRMVGSEMQIRIWRHVLASLAKYLEVPADVSVEARCIDPGLQWSQAGNIWYNAQARTILSAPVWWVSKKIQPRRK